MCWNPGSFRCCNEALLISREHKVTRVEDETQLSMIMKKCIIFFRILYGYIRLLPMHRVLKKLDGATKKNPLKVSYRITTDKSQRPDEMPIDQPLVDGEPQPTASEHVFEPIDTHVGQLLLSVKYRRNCNLRCEEIAKISSCPTTLLRSREHINIDEDFFTPDLADGQRMLGILAKSASVILA